MKTYLLTEDAERDIDVIKLYLLAESGPSLVRRVLGKIEAALELLGRVPGADIAGPI